MVVQVFTFNAFQENTYVLYNDAKRCWIIDPGMMQQQEEEELISFIEGHQLKPQAILNTHAHIDHILGVEFLKKTFNIPFFLHPLEEPILRASAGSAALFGLPFGAIPTVNEPLEEGKIIMLGEEAIKLLLVPGHSPGSIAFYHEKDKWVISGDALFAGSIGRTDLPGGNHQQLLQSITTQLFSLPDEVTVYAGHGPATHIGQERQYNPFF